MKNILCCKDNTKVKADFEKVIDFLKIINEPNRLRILCLLRDGEQCVCEIWKSLDLPQNLTSHHLKTLKDFGLIESKQKGRKIFYSSKKDVVKKYTSILNIFLFSQL